MERPERISALVMAPMRLMLPMSRLTEMRPASPP